MNRLIFKWFAFIVLALIVGCEPSNEFVFMNEGCELNSTKISPEEASLQAQHFLEQLSHKDNTRSTKFAVISSIQALKKKKVSSLTRSSTEVEQLPDTLMYIITFDNQGSVLVSADRRLPGLLAYWENKEIDNQEEFQDEGMRLFWDGLYDFICDKLVVSPPVDFDFPPFGPNPGLYTFCVDTLVSPLLRTNWGQWEPYNFYCKTPSGHSAPTGCVATAVAQLLAYHKSPSSYANHIYDWDEILVDGEVPLTTQAQLMVAHLMADLGSLMGMNYTDTLSTVNSDSVSHCLDTLNYHHVGLVDYDYSICMNEILNQRPVYIKGAVSEQLSNKGHAWIIDGAMVTSYHIPITHYLTGHTIILREQISHLVHCNWGNDGTYNGFFISNAFDMCDGKIYDSNYTNTRSQYNYTYHLKVYYNIYPIQ